MLIGSLKYKGSVYRLVMVKRCGKMVYFVNSFNSVGFVSSVRFSTLCSAYKYFIRVNSKKTKSITNQNQVSLW